MPMMPVSVHVASPQPSHVPLTAYAHVPTSLASAGVAERHEPPTSKVQRARRVPTGPVSVVHSESERHASVVPTGPAGRWQRGTLSGSLRQTKPSKHCDSLVQRMPGSNLETHNGTLRPSRKAQTRSTVHASLPSIGQQGAYSAPAGGRLVQSTSAGSGTPVVASGRPPSLSPSTTLPRRLSVQAMRVMATRATKARRAGSFLMARRIPPTPRSSQRGLASLLQFSRQIANSLLPALPSCTPSARGSARR